MTRTDIHRPSLLDPADYEFLGAFYQGTSKAMMISYMSDEVALDNAISRTGAKPFSGNYEAKKSCDHCGTPFAHGVCFRHIPTNTYISVGHVCAADTIGLPTKAAVAKRAAEKAQAEETARLARHEANADWQSKNADIIEFLKGVEQAEAAWRTWNEEHPDAGHPQDTGPRTNPNKAPHAFLNDMVHTFNRWGNLSEKQSAATRKFMAKAEEFAQRDAEKPAEITPETPLAEGRREITGTIVTTKWKESDYGSTLKMLVVQADGNKVWGTVPEHAWSAFKAETGDDFKGRAITFTATVERSADDEHFGFFKRPTGAKPTEEV